MHKNMYFCTYMYTEDTYERTKWGSGLSVNAECPALPNYLMYVSLNKAAKTLLQYGTDNTNAHTQQANITNLAAIIK